MLYFTCVIIKGKGPSYRYFNIHYPKYSWMLTVTLFNHRTRMHIMCILSSCVSRCQTYVFQKLTCIVYLSIHDISGCKCTHIFFMLSPSNSKQEKHWTCMILKHKVHACCQLRVLTYLIALSEHSTFGTSIQSRTALNSFSLPSECLHGSHIQATINMKNLVTNHRYKHYNYECTTYVLHAYNA